MLGWMPSRMKIRRLPNSSAENFLPAKAHIKEHPAWFHRFDAVWTPTVLLLDSEGKERVRLEGLLPNNDFVAALISGLGRIAFVHKKYADAERWYGEVVGRFFRPVSYCAGSDVLDGCVGTTRRPTITRCWAKLPRSFGTHTRPAYGRARRFHGWH